jgi:transcriptional regulator with XRE-family HTH domain
MEKLGLSAYRVSKDTGISQASLADWRKGRSNPKIDKLQKLAAYFGVSIYYLTGEVDDFDSARQQKIGFIKSCGVDTDFSHYDDESIDDIYVAMQLRGAAAQNKKASSRIDVKEDAQNMDLKKILGSHSVMFYGDYELNDEEKNIIEGVIQGVLSRKKK